MQVRSNSVLNVASNVASNFPSNVHRIIRDWGRPSGGHQKACIGPSDRTTPALPCNMPQQKQEGESCGPCMSITGDCGSCALGLTCACVGDCASKMIADTPSTCQPPMNVNGDTAVWQAEATLNKPPAPAAPVTAPDPPPGLPDKPPAAAPVTAPALPWIVSKHGYKPVKMQAPAPAPAPAAPVKTPAPGVPVPWIVGTHGYKPGETAAPVSSEPNSSVDSPADRAVHLQGYF